MSELVDIYENANADTHVALEMVHSFGLNRGRCQRDWAEVSSWPHYAATPIRRLPGLANSTGVDKVLYKDESLRFGLNSFKALGGALAVRQLIGSHLERTGGCQNVSTADLLNGRHKALTQKLTFATATDGNHGRSVAWGARMFGARSVIFIHRGVSEARAQALRKQGAEVIRAGADYDESVSITSSEANENGWTVVSDTSYAGYTATPATIMRGYTLMMKEIDEALEPGERPSHIIVQCGVGALAAAVAAFAVEVWQSGMAPKIVVVEPSSAACLFESAKAGRLVRCKGSAESFMAGLACGVPSLIGWNILRSAANFFMTAPDSLVAGSMRQLGEGHCGDIPIVAGESAVAGVMLLKYARAHLDIFDMLGLAKDSRVLVFGTEGDTDPVIYQEVLSGLRD